MNQTSTFEEYLPLVPSRHPDFDLQDDFLINRQRPHDAVYASTTAVLIWGLCDGATTVEQISLELGDAFPDQRAEVRNDVLATIAVLRKYGVVSFADAV